MKYETVPTPKNLGNLDTAEAIPVSGKYSFYDVTVLGKHAEWFEDIGVDRLLLDWSDVLRTRPAICTGARWATPRAATR